MTSVSLPKLTRTETQARNLLACHGLRCKIELGKTWLAELSLRPLGEQHGPIDPVDVLVAEWAGANLVLSLPDGALAAWAREMGICQETLSSLPEPLALATIELLCSELTAAADNLGRGSVRLTRYMAEVPRQLPHRLLLTLKGPDTNEVIYGLLAVDTLGLMILSSLVANNPVVQNEVSWSVLPMPICVTIGEATITVRDLEDLAVHDVIWLSSDLLSGDSLYVMVGDRWQSGPVSDGGRWCFRARLEGASLIVVEPPRHMKTDTQATASDRDDQVDLGQIPVRISFELGEQVIPLEQLQTMQPGQVFDLGAPLGRAVSIRANGALIGAGELVDIEGRAGVAVLSLFNPGSTDAPSDSVPDETSEEA